MQPFSAATVKMLQDMNTQMYVDDVEINPMVEIDDGFGNVIEKFPHSGNFCKGSLQEVLRIPGTPEIGSTTTSTAGFILKLEADARLPMDQPQKCQFQVNGGDLYEAENVYRDRKDRLSLSVYCYRIE